MPGSSPGMTTEWVGRAQLKSNDRLQLIREMPWNAKIPAHPVWKAVNRRKNP
jgi:hypothetical protein